MRFLYLSIILLAFSNPIFCQKSAIDSLRILLNHTADVEKQINIELELTGLFARQNIDSTRKYGHSALKKAKQINDKLLQCQSYLKMIFGYGNVMITPPNDTTWLYLDLAQRLAEQIDYTAGIARINNVKGVLYFQKGEFEKGIAHYFVAEKLFEELKDTLYAGFTKNNIGNYYNYAKKYDKALEYLIQSKEIFIRFKQDYQLFSNLSNIFSIYVATHDTINVIKAIDEYYPMAQSSEYVDFKILSTGYKGIQFTYLKNNDSAAYYYKKAIHFADSLNKPELIDRIYINLGTLYFHEEKWDKAEETFQQGLEIARKTKSYQTELMALDYLSNVYQKKGKYKEALQYLSFYKHLLDSTKIEFTGSFAEKALSEQELKQKAAELAQLKVNQAANRKLTIIGLSLLSFLLFIIIWHIQASLLFNFSKTYLSKNEHGQAKSAWDYIPPVIMPGQLNTITSALIYAALNVVGVVFFFGTNASFTSLTLWGLVCLLLFWGAERLFFLYYTVHNGLPFKMELIRFLTGLIPFLVILCLTALTFKFINPTFVEISELALTATTCFFIAMSLGTLIQYRLRFEAMTEELIVGFNAKLAEKKPSVASTNENIECTKVQIEDNGKMVEINLTNLLFIVSDNVYQEFFLFEGDKTCTTLVRNTLGNIEKSLNGHHAFLRCHRSYIVNTNRIASIIRKSRQYYFVLDKTNEKIPISRNAENEILEKFTSYLSN